MWHNITEVLDLQRKFLLCGVDDNRTPSVRVSETFAELSADEHLPGHSHNKVSGRVYQSSW